MPQKILIAQDVKELKFLYGKNIKNFKCLPLDLKTQLYCVDKGIDYFNLLKFSNNEFHSKVQFDTEKIIEQIDLQYLKSKSFREEFIGWLRARIYSIIFLILILEKINLENKIEEIVVTGWDDFSDIMSQYNYFLSYLVNNLFKNTKITNITNDFKNKNIHFDQRTYFFNESLKKGRNFILLSGLGYNFKRIFNWTIKNNYSIVYPIKEKINFFKKKFYMLFKIYPMQLKSKLENSNEFNFSFNQNISYNEIPISNCIFHPELPLKKVIFNYKKQSEAIDTFFKKNKLKLAISSTARGIGGCILEKAQENNVKALCIPHGTLSSGFDEKDKLYKKIISRAIIPDSNIKFVSQSKICENFVKSNKISNFLESGNLIFTETKKKTESNILYAVTQKDFHNMQFHGVETFYEFFDNLNYLNSICPQTNKKFIVKPHPQEFDSINYLQNKFKNLIFTKEKNDTLFKKIMVTISFSSTIIEDSLHSGVPVILFDRWNRYQHCNAEKNPSKKNAAVYYLNQENNLMQCIKTISNSDQINFEEYVFDGKSNNNLDKVMKSFLN